MQTHHTPLRAPAPATGLRARSGRILVVDDDECIRGLLKLHLRNAGYEVLAVEDAIAAGHRLLHDVPDLMIVDVDMPFMNGFELVAAVRSDAELPFFPVLFLTAQPDVAERARELGCACVNKPVRADRLLAMVRRYTLREEPQQPSLRPTAATA